MNGKDKFNMDNIKEAIENDFKSSYSIVKNRKEMQLRNDFNNKLTQQKTLNESFQDFIIRHNIDLSIDRKEIIDKFSFYNSSSQFDEIYNKLMEEKDFKADPNIFKDQYEILVEKVKLEEKKRYERIRKTKIRFRRKEKMLKILKKKKKDQIYISD